MLSRSKSTIYKKTLGVACRLHARMMHRKALIISVSFIIHASNSGKENNWQRLQLLGANYAPHLLSTKGCSYRTRGPKILAISLSVCSRLPWLPVSAPLPHQLMVQDSGYQLTTPSCTQWHKSELTQVPARSKRGNLNTHFNFSYC